MVKTLRQAISELTAHARGGKLAGQDQILAAYGDNFLVEGPTVVTGEDGHLFVHCGGQAVLKLQPVNIVGRTVFYVVVDDRASWGWKSAPESGPKPPDVLRLVASA